MAEEAPKSKINFKKIALFGLGPILLVGVGLGAGAYLFMPTQTPAEQVEQLIEKKLKQAGQLPSEEGLNEEDLEPQKISKETPVNETFVTTQQPKTKPYKPNPPPQSQRPTLHAPS